MAISKNKSFFENKFKKFIPFIILLIIVIIFTLILANLIPYNMDEFSHYRPIICHHYKYNSLNQFREGCGSYDVNFLNSGIILPLRSNNYIGSFASLYYYPLFVLWKSPISARMLGLGFLVVQVILLGLIFKEKYQYILLGLVFFFPYFYQHIIETGTILFSLTSIFLIYYLSMRWVKNFKMRYPLIIVFLIFLGLWSKINYFWLIPGIFVIVALNIFERRRLIFERELFKKLVLQSTASFILLIFLLSLLFSPVGIYYSEITKDSNSLGLSNNFGGLLVSLMNPYMATHRTFNNFSPKFIIIYDLFILLTFVCGFLLFFKKVDRRYRQLLIKFALLFFSGIVTLAIIFITSKSWAYHHIILSFPFFILSISFLFTYLKKIGYKKFIFYWLIVFVVLNLVLFSTFLTQPVRGHDDFSKVEVNNILGNEYLANNYFYVVVDWGMYFYQALYGNENQSVIYTRSRKFQKDIENLAGLSEEHGRKVLFIYRTEGSVADIELIKSSFELKDCNLMDSDSVWNILIEEDDSLENPCFN